MSYEAWKTAAVSYAWTAYCLPDDCIEDDLYRPKFEAGARPQEAVDEHCEKCDIGKAGLWGTI